MSKKEKIKLFDPNGYSTSEALFGLPFTREESQVWVLPVPWEVTVSYEAGTAKAPEAVKKASLQVDLYDPFLQYSWKRGVYMLEVSKQIEKRSHVYRTKAEVYLDGLFKGAPDVDLLREINKASKEMVHWVKQESTKALNAGKELILLGGDHSTPLGFIQALAARFESFGILQVDAHADLRKAYEGFTYSHASIMYNALALPQVERLVQVGIRDYCEEEAQYIEESQGRVCTFFDRDIKQKQFGGVSWADQCTEIVAQLPAKVYLSFDIDGLDPKLCPNTGTPVAGGFEVEEVLYLLERVVESGREIIGLDLNEIAPGEDEWDANVGARLLYRLSNIMTRSKRKS